MVDASKKRWRLARLLIWGGLLLAALGFWLVAGAVALAWLR
jgi:hypothetical protein